ncbi:hypothetical protein BELL_0280g00010 [Botrytis elliptica]|uniref:Uncharacterized protein n=1 Tax=Botrytis elliptica TaxID=278938 RepID=A0A4Z1JL38_9HELO|nr:hypothetical protein BELL_0280g00010 [Botrytis elliptica]
MGLLSTAVAAASAAQSAVPLGNQIILESNYQRVTNPDAKALYSLPPNCNGVQMKTIRNSKPSLLDKVLQTSQGFRDCNS